MQFARNTGMHAVFIASTNPEIAFPHELIDARFNSLLAFAEAIHHLIKNLRLIKKKMTGNYLCLITCNRTFLLMLYTL